MSEKLNEAFIAATATMTAGQKKLLIEIMKKMMEEKNSCNRKMQGKRKKRSEP